MFRTFSPYLLLIPTFKSSLFDINSHPIDRAEPLSDPTKIKFGPSRLKELPDALKDANISKPLLVTDPVLAGLPVVKEIGEILKGAGIPLAVFSDIRSNPVASNVEAGLKVYRNGKHDGVIAFGGGSGLDTGKAIAFMAGQTRPLWDFEDIGRLWLTRQRSSMKSSSRRRQ